MTADLASTFFQTSIDDDLAAVDVYTQTSANAPIDPTASPSNDPDGVTSFLGSVPGVGDAVQEALKTVPEIPLSSSEIQSSVIAPNSDLLSSFNSLDASVKQQLTATTDQINQIISSDTSATPPTLGSTSLTSAKNVTSLSGMLDIIGGKKGATTVANVSAQSTFLSNLVGLSANLNIPNAFGRIAAGGFSPQVMNQVTKAALTATVSTSNVNMLVDVANNALSGSVKAVFPGFASTFAANFKLGAGTNPTQHAQIGLDISSALGKIDANWSSSAAGNRTMVSGNFFLNASNDFKTVMQASATFSRGPLSSTSATVTGVASSSIPSIASLSASVLHKSVSVTGGLQSTFVWPNGLSKTFTPATDGSGTYSETTVTPQVLATDPTSIANVNASTITNPLALGNAFGSCMAQGQADALAGGTTDPTIDASASLQNNFPLLPFGNLPTFSV